MNEYSRGCATCNFVSSDILSKLSRPDAFAKPILIEPPMQMTCSLVHSGGLPLTNAGQALRDFLIGFIERRVRQPDMPGVKWITKD